MIGVIGSVCADEILYLDFLPTLSQDAKILKREMKLGGCAYYVSKAIQDCTLISSIGTGVYADYILNHIQDEIFECILIPRKEENGVCICEIDHGERTFLSLHGAEYNLNGISDEIEDFNWIYLSGIDLEENKDLLKSIDKNLFISPGPRYKNLDMNSIYSKHPVLHMNMD